VFIPLSQLIGGEDFAGQGWRMLVECLSVGRAITLPSTASGGAKMGAIATGAYARIRKQFGLSIGRFEGVQEALARIAGKAYAISALAEATASAVDRGEKPAVPSAIAKYHCTEMGRDVVIDAMDVHGGKGIILGPRNYLGRGWQATPISITVEGANIMTRSLMIFGQGAILCHPWVLKEMKAAMLPDEAERLEEFDRNLFGHIGFALSNAVRSLWFGLTAASIGKAPGDGYTAATTASSTATRRCWRCARTPRCCCWAASSSSRSRCPGAWATCSATCTSPARCSSATRTRAARSATGRCWPGPSTTACTGWRPRCLRRCATSRSARSAGCCGCWCSRSAAARRRRATASGTRPPAC
jgi:alkylation response protein AidB-like acyl-CoA dehydrogenase